MEYVDLHTVDGRAPFAGQGGTLRLINYPDGNGAAFQTRWHPPLSPSLLEKENVQGRGAPMWERALRERCVSRLDKLCGEHLGDGARSAGVPGVVAVRDMKFPVFSTTISANETISRGLISGMAARC
jgi:hypothetical protein